MDEQVKQALAKWPNVPACYGWLALDMRGYWHIQSQENVPHLVSIIQNQALIDFINRNYLSDELGRWFFQNGPQRVYVELAATPFVARLQHQQWQLHTGKILGQIDQIIWCACEASQDSDPLADRLLVVSGGIPALIDDRDTQLVLDRLRVDGQTINEALLNDWLNYDKGLLRFDHIRVERMLSTQLEKYFSYIRHPHLQDKEVHKK